MRLCCVCFSLQEPCPSPPSSVLDPPQTSSRVSSIDDATQREFLFKTNGDFWSHEELQRLHHALRTPNLGKFFEQRRRVRSCHILARPEARGREEGRGRRARRKKKQSLSVQQEGHLAQLFSLLPLPSRASFSYAWPLHCKSGGVWAQSAFPGSSSLFQLDENFHMPR